MIRYDPMTENIGSTLLGQIGSYFYISCSSIEIYNKYLNSMNSYSELLSVICLSVEFKQLIARQEELFELEKMKEMCKEKLIIKGETEYAEKANILIQVKLILF